MKEKNASQEHTFPENNGMGTSETCYLLEVKYKWPPRETLPRSLKKKKTKKTFASIFFPCFSLVKVIERANSAEGTAFSEAEAATVVFALLSTVHR